MNLLHFHRRLCLVLILNGNYVKAIFFDSFIRTCNAPEILNHPMREQHTYCQHSCGQNTEFRCNENGFCICSLPCYTGNQPRPGALAPDICPPKATDPPSTNTLWPILCNFKCSLECTGGTGEVCGETVPLPDATGAPTLFALICNCVCPPQNPCPPVTTVPATTANPLVQLAAALGALKIKKKISSLILFFKKAYIVGWIVVKLYAICALFLGFIIVSLGVYLANIGVDPTELIGYISRLLNTVT